MVITFLPATFPLILTDCVMKSYSNLSAQDIELICDYLENPSKDAADDYSRRKALYAIGIHKKTKKIESNGKYLSGPLGEGIVRIYYEKLGVEFQKPPEQKYIEEDGDSQKEVILRPDGKVYVTKWVEDKMRAYYSKGTAHEKIPGVPQKYAPIGGKLILFLMADDEHKYNRGWTKLRRGEVKPSNKSQEYHLLGDLEVLDSIILGTEVAKVLKS